MEHYIKDIEEPQSQRLQRFLRDEGIALPPITSDKGKANPGDVPQSARLTDAEIANLIVTKMGAALQLLSVSLITTFRNDVAAMLYAFQNQLLKEGLVLKQTMIKRGWAKIPPAFTISKPSDEHH